MKKSIRLKVAREKRRILQRLAKAAPGPDRGPVMSATNIQYEIADKGRGIAHGGIGAVHLLVRKLGLAEAIDARMHVLKKHSPYHESDHVLNLAYNAICGGRTLDDIELRRNDRNFLDAIGAASIPDPTTEGDFCRRCSQGDIDSLQEAFNEKRVEVWKAQSSEFREEVACIDADGTLVPTEGDCKEGMDISYNGVWGYHPLLVSFANTGEPLFILNRSGNRPSHEGVVPLFDAAIALVRRGGFTQAMLRGDTDFAMTAHFDRWDDDDVKFVFGYDARRNLIDRAEFLPDFFYRQLEERAEHEIMTRPRAKQPDVKDRIVRARGFQTIRPIDEEVVDFRYQPTSCSRPYRVVALRKNLSITRGETVLFDDVRYFFFITNELELSADEIVHQSRIRCNQENLIAQLKGGVRALHAPVNALEANGAYMVATALAWTLKAWMALTLPVEPRQRDEHLQQREQLLRMEFRSFRAAIINIPAQVITAGRRVVLRLLAWNPWQHVFFRLLDGL